MATNKNGDEPRTTAFEIQVKTLAATMERLNRKNHDLKEQLHQKDTGPCSHGEKQKGTNAERRDREEPEGSNAPTRHERQDTSHPSFTNTAP